MPPYILYKAKHLYDSWCVGGPPNTHYNTSASGWMEADSFFEWFESLFLKYKQSGACVLFFDNHNSHITLKLVNLAIKNNVHLICIPPHTSHVFQPLDVAAYKPLKSSWRKIVHEYYHDNYCKVIDKQNFPRLINQLNNTFKEDYGISGFRKTGLYPLDKR